MFNPPTLEDLQETRRANEKLVLEALDSKPEWVETELAKTTGLALSHLRAALASLLDQGRVRRLPGTGTRAVYGLADPGLADVPATPLTEDAVRIREYLEGRADSALYMSDQLRLTREEVMAALSLLNAHGMITCTFVGSLVIFRLKEQQALDAEAAEAAAEAEASAAEGAKAPAKKPARTVKKAKADPAEPVAEASAPVRKPAGKVAKAAADTASPAEGVSSLEADAQPAKATKKVAGKATEQQSGGPAEKPPEKSVEKSAEKPAKKPAAKKPAPVEDAAGQATAEQTTAEQTIPEAGAEAKKPAVRKRVKKPVS